MTAAELIDILLRVECDSRILIEVDIGELVLTDVTATSAMPRINGSGCGSALVLTADPERIALFGEP